MRLKAMAAKRVELLEASIALRRKGKLEQEQTNVISDKGNAQMEVIRALFAEMRQAEHKLLQERQSESQRTYSFAQTTSLLTVSLGIINGRVVLLAALPEPGGPAASRSHDRPTARMAS